jgi:hypothetical protein
MPAKPTGSIPPRKPPSRADLPHAARLLEQMPSIRPENIVRYDVSKFGCQPRAKCGDHQPINGQRIPAGLPPDFIPRDSSARTDQVRNPLKPRQANLERVVDPGSVGNPLDALGRRRSDED